MDQPNFEPSMKQGRGPFHNPQPQAQQIPLMVFRSIAPIATITAEKIGCFTAQRRIPRNTFTWARNRSWLSVTCQWLVSRVYRTQEELPYILGGIFNNRAPLFLEYHKQDCVAYIYVADELVYVHSGAYTRSPHGFDTWHVAIRLA